MHWVYDKGSWSLILVRTIRKDGSFRVSNENHENRICSRGSISPMRSMFEVFLGSNRSWRSSLLRKLDAIRLTRPGTSETSAVSAAHHTMRGDVSGRFCLIRVSPTRVIGTVSFAMEL